MTIVAGSPVAWAIRELPRFDLKGEPSIYSLTEYAGTTMDIEQLRKLCLSFPGTTEQIQWGDNLLFKVGGKMFAVTTLVPAKVWISFKTTDENFADLTERPGVIPAPYLARAKWIALESREALTRAELEQLVRESYELVLAKLPQKSRQAIALRKTSPSSAHEKSTRRVKTKASRKKRRA